MPFRFMSSISPTIAFSKDAFPNQRRTFACRTKSFSLPKPAQSSCVTASRDQLLRKSSSAISRLSFALRSRAAQLQLLRSIRPAFWNLSPGGLSFRELWPHPYDLTGPATLDRCCERNVVAPREYSKGFFCVPKGLYRAILWPATALGMPARSALGAATGINPAAVIKAWIWAL